MFVFFLWISVRKCMSYLLFCGSENDRRRDREGCVLEDSILMFLTLNK